MKKILFLPSWYPTTENPIYGSFFREQAELLSAKYDVKVLAVSAPKYKFKELVSKVLKQGGLARDITSLAIMPPECRMFEFAQPNKRWQGRLTYLLHYKFLCKQLDLITERGWLPDIIHAHSIYGSGLFVHELAKHCGAKSVMTEHCPFSLNGLPYRYQKKALKILQNVDQLVSVSEHLARMIFGHGVERSIDICGNWVDEKSFVPSDQKHRKFTFINVASHPMFIKGTRLLFEALSLLGSPWLGGVQFVVICGNESNKQLYRQWAGEYGVEDSIVFEGMIDREKMPDYVARCHSYISTSYAETFGVAIREAMMCGLPVVSVDCGGIDREIFDKNGIVTPLGDANALALAIKKMMRNYEGFSAAEIRHLCIENHGSAAFVKKIDSIYS